MREKIIALIEGKIKVTKPECLAEVITDALIEEGYLSLAKLALLEELREAREDLEDYSKEVAVWNSRENRGN